MSQYLAFVAFVLVASISQTIAELRELPDFIQVCHGNDLKINECMVESIERIRPKLARGIPEMDVPSVEPLDVGNLLVSERATRNGLQVTARAIKAYNASQFSVSHMNVVEHGRLYTFDVHFPTMFVVGTYTIEGQLLLFPVNGAGDFNGTFSNIVSHNRVTFGRHTINGTAFANIDRVDTRITLEQGRMHFSNLFNGDEVLEQAVNMAINENFSVLADDIIPLVETALNKMFKRIGNKICKPFTWDQFFPMV